MVMFNLNKNEQNAISAHDAAGAMQDMMTILDALRVADRAEGV